MNDETQLTNLKVDEISLVGAGANGEVIQVFKSAGAVDTKKDDAEAESEKPDDCESDIEKAFKKALSPIVEKMATLEVQIGTIAQAQSAMPSQEQVAKSVAEQVSVEVNKALDLHKQLVDEKVSAIQAGVGVLGDAIKAGLNYDDLWMPFTHVSDALCKLKNDSMTLQLQGLSAEVTKSVGGKKEAILKFASALPAYMTEVVKTAQADAAQSKLAEIEKALEKIQADVAVLVDAPAAPAGAAVVQKGGDKPSAFTGMFRPG